jgi:DNA-directed RNA polymerase subunit alpha
LLNRVLPQIECEASSRQYGRFVISPLESGYGITLGNALRRVLLSSLPGAAVTSIRVSGVHHEFSVIPHVKEDMTGLILNVKQLRFQVHSQLDESFRVHLEVTSEGDVTGADLSCPAQVDIINPELYLLTADSNDVDLDIEFVVGTGRGYSPAEERGRLPIGEIPVDAIFSPVRKANYKVTRTRVGQMTDYDKLVMEVWTDGSISPEAAVSESARILVEHLSRIAGLDEALVAPATSAGGDPGDGIPSSVADAAIEELELSVRAYNCLKRAGIVRVGEILTMLEQGEDEILAIRNFGRKSLFELLDKLEAKGFLSLIDFTLSSDEDDDDDEDDDEEDEIDF